MSLPENIDILTAHGRYPTERVAIGEKTDLSYKDLWKRREG
jgi:hypothetical protein